MHFTDRMPARTSRAHFEPSWKGDHFAGLQTAHKRGSRYIDCNFQVAYIDPKDHDKGFEIFSMHWPRPGQNNYKALRVGTGIRWMSPAELVRPIEQWPAHEVLNWRRSKTANYRPPTYYEMCREAKRIGIYITAEVKSNLFANPYVAKLFVTQAKRAGHPPWAMALYGSMPLCEQKCAAIVNAVDAPTRVHGQFAVIFGTYQRLRGAFKTSLRKWRVKPTEVW